MAFFKFFMAAAPAGLVPTPDHRGKQLAVAVKPAALLVHKPGLFVGLAVNLVMVPAWALMVIKGDKLHIPNPPGQLRIICFHHNKPQPLGGVTSVGQQLPVIFLPVIRITGGNEVVNVFMKKSGIPGSHQLFRGGGNGLTRKIGPATRVTFVSAFATAERFRHSFPPFARHSRYLISNPLFYY